MTFDPPPTADRIHLRNIRSYGYTGFLAEERALGQWFSVDLTLWIDLKAAGASDELADTFDYRAAIETAKTTIAQSKYDLVERLAKALAARIIAIDPNRLACVRVRLTKEAAPIPDFGGEIVIDIHRTPADCMDSIDSADCASGDTDR
ncbi:MAG: dihydroneopterin aldolase [Geitlerinemataceae cyanobacterium]